MKREQKARLTFTSLWLILLVSGGYFLVKMLFNIHEIPVWVNVISLLFTYGWGAMLSAYLIQNSLEKYIRKNVDEAERIRRTSEELFNG